MKKTTGRLTRLAFDQKSALKATRYMGCFVVTFAMLVGGVSGAAQADDSQSHQAIMQAASDFLTTQYVVENSQDELKIVINSLDARLALKPCDMPLEAFWPYERNNSRRVSVGVRCSAPAPWKIFLQARVQHFKSVPVLRHSVSKGDTLNASMLQLQRRDVLKLRGEYVADTGPLLGMSFARSTPSGTAIRSDLLVAPAWVKRGEQVNIVGGSSVVSVHTQGQALSDGRQGDVIRVKNSRSKRVLQAIVTQMNTVRVIQ